MKLRRLIAPTLALTVLSGSSALVACVAESGAATGEQHAATAERATPATRTYPKTQLGEAISAEVPVTLVVTGSIEPRDRADVVPDISGKVIEVLVDRGDVVKAGDPLVRLDIRAAELSEREARANLGALAAQRKLAEDTCRRSKELFDKGAITKAEYDRDLATCTQARQNVAGASARLERAAQQKEDGIIRAPFSGTIGERHISLGEWASPQGRLFTLVDDGALRADLMLSEAAAVHAEVGATVVITPVADKQNPITATITKLGVEIDPKTRALKVEVALPDGASVKPGMFVAAKLETGKQTLVAVPQAALVKRGTTWRVFASVGDRLEERVVQRGPDTADGRATIARGLTAGESFATVVDAETVDGVSVQ